MDEQLQSLLPFLHDRNPEARQIALENLVGYTPKESKYRHIFLSGLGTGLSKTKDPDVIRDLKLLCRDQLTIAHDAFRALVNLSDSSLLLSPLSEPTFLVFLISYTISPFSTLADMAAMLLSNLSIHAAFCSTLLNTKIPVLLTPQIYPMMSRAATSVDPMPPLDGEIHEIDALTLLIDAFTERARSPTNSVPEAESDRPSTKNGSLHFLASVFANVSVTPAGRTFLLTPSRSAMNADVLEFPLAKLVVFTEHPDTIRRGGISSTIKNCAFHRDAHRALLSPEEDLVSVPPSTVKAPGINILQYLLLPLAGPEELDIDEQDDLPASLQFLPSTKKREPDTSLRLMHVETLLLLCTTRWGRDFLRQHGTYQIIRRAHEVETIDNVSEHIEQLAGFLKRDEGKETENDEASEDRVGDIAVEATLDDEDSRIEEV
ncbi:DUF383-domain-containing protein [Sistotremastrum niveocremeum HHB9708]|uniref:DUF383-domain-containing protein n=2 Tax=Sistotremastraceae TaxID=3402574 RepID=A0A164VQZ2_9AGAM|nr:DUF383-domain-containing protein [Sistotremastrum niveocremeum HHB9708]KZT34885.1 DUF383-domain-containing protein [Sistotremastrum suecicum HHB10207 ss-3]